MLPGSEQIDKFDIDHHYALVLDQLKNLFRSHLTRHPPSRLRGGRPLDSFDACGDTSIEAAPISDDCRVEPNDHEPLRQ
jgi:hypothetical protein